MTTVELKAWIESEIKEINDLLSEQPIRYTHLNGEIPALRRVLKKLDQLKLAPVYHYLPEVPQDGERVVAFYLIADETFTEISFYDGEEWIDELGYPYKGVYAWCRIPPKPPIKEGGQPRICPLCDGVGRRVFPNCNPPIDKTCEGCEGLGILQTINEKMQRTRDKSS